MFQITLAVKEKYITSSNIISNQRGLWLALYGSKNDFIYLLVAKRSRIGLQQVYGVLKHISLQLPVSNPVLLTFDPLFQFFWMYVANMVTLSSASYTPSTHTTTPDFLIPKHVFLKLHLIIYFSLRRWVKFLWTFPICQSSTQNWCSSVIWNSINGLTKRIVPPVRMLPFRANQTKHLSVICFSHTVQKATRQTAQRES